MVGVKIGRVAHVVPATVNIPSSSDPWGNAVGLYWPKVLQVCTGSSSIAVVVNVV